MCHIFLEKGIVVSVPLQLVFHLDPNSVQSRLTAAHALCMSQAICTWVSMRALVKRMEPHYTITFSVFQP